MGDVNLNILESNSTTSCYLDILSYHGLLPTSYFPTREKTCLDHVILKTKSIAYSLTIESSVTDHLSNLLCLSMAKKDCKPPRKTFNKINYDLLYKQCAEVNLVEATAGNNLETTMNLLIESLTKLIIDNTLIVRIPRSRLTIKPWITIGLLRCIRNRDRMHERLRSEGNNEILRPHTRGTEITVIIS